MSVSLIRISMLSLASILAAASIVSKAQDTRPATSDRSECEGCISQVIQLPKSFSVPEIQEVMNAFRMVLELRIINTDVRNHTLSIRGNPEQVAVARKLVSALETFGTDGALPVVVHEPKDASPTSHELSSSYVKAFYKPTFSMQQMHTAVNSLRLSAHILRIQQMPDTHVIVVRGTSEQIAEADKLLD